MLLAIKIANNAINAIIDITDGIINRTISCSNTR